jgi:putative hydrolase of the HAD superfamily
MTRKTRGCILFDWGETLMRVFKEFSGPMKDWPRVESIPGAAELLATLHPDWILAIATNAEVSGEADIRAALQRADLDQFLDKVYCFKNIGYKKPSPEFFQYILEDLQLAPQAIFMVGDNYEADVLGANRFNIRAIWFNQHSLDIRENDLQRTIHAMGELPDTLNGFV